MPKGTSLAKAIQQALSTAFPNVPINLAISPNLVLVYDDKGYYQSVEQYLNYVKTFSHSILGTPSTTGYQGVRVNRSSSFFDVFDGTVPGSAIQLLFEDLVGQPTSVGANMIQIRTVLRGDIIPNMNVILPQNVLVTTFNTGEGSSTFYPSLPFLKYQPGAALTCQGSFMVKSIIHRGHFRNPNAENNWVTTIDAIPNLPTLPTGNNVVNQSGKQVFTSAVGGPGTSR